MTGWRRRAATLAALLAASSPGAAQPNPNRLAACFACHGEAGRSQTADVPSIAGQPAFYVITQLFLFREGRRGKSVMLDAARGLSDDDLRALSDAVAQLPPPPVPAQGLQQDRFARGRAHALEHRCNVCHGPDYAGGDQVPRLANQREDYLLRALREFKSGTRIGYTGAMAEVLAALNAESLADVAHYLAHLPGRR